MTPGNSRRVPPSMANFQRLGEGHFVVSISVIGILRQPFAEVLTDAFPQARVGRMSPTQSPFFSKLINSGKTGGKRAESEFAAEGETFLGKKADNTWVGRAILSNIKKRVGRKRVPPQSLPFASAWAYHESS